jgi:hypothetical protein
VNSIALVKPEKAKMVEGMLIRMASKGQLGGKVGHFTVGISLQFPRYTEHFYFNVIF